MIDKGFLLIDIACFFFYYMTESTMEDMKNSQLEIFKVKLQTNHHACPLASIM